MLKFSSFAFLALHAVGKISVPPGASSLPASRIKDSSRKDSASVAKIFVLSRPEHERSMCQPGLRIWEGPQLSSRLVGSERAPHRPWLHRYQQAYLRRLQARSFSGPSSPSPPLLLAMKTPCLLHRLWHPLDPAMIWSNTLRQMAIFIWHISKVSYLTWDPELEQGS